MLLAACGLMLFRYPCSSKAAAAAAAAGGGRLALAVARQHMFQ